VKQEIKDQIGHVVATAELYDTGSSNIEFDISRLMPSLMTLWLIEADRVTGPNARLFVVRAREDSPWLEVKLGPPDRPREFAIWRATGNIYRVTDGEVSDDPMVSM
jgi:hypothetical protein